MTIDGGSSHAYYYIISKNGQLWAYQSSYASDVTVGNIMFSSNDAPECAWHNEVQNDINGSGLFLYINIIVIGA